MSGISRRTAVIVAPDALALPDIAIGQRAGMKGQRPAVFLRQRGEALHRRAFEALRDDLVEAEEAAFARPLAVGEGDRRRVELGEGPARPFALAAMARRAIFGIERRAARRVGNARRGQGDRIGGEQVGRELARRAAISAGAAFAAIAVLQGLGVGEQRLARGLAGKRG